MEIQESGTLLVSPDKTKLPPSKMIADSDKTDRTMRLFKVRIEVINTDAGNC